MRVSVVAIIIGWGVWGLGDRGKKKRRGFYPPPLG